MFMDVPKCWAGAGVAKTRVRLWQSFSLGQFFCIVMEQTFIFPFGLSLEAKEDFLGKCLFDRRVDLVNLSLFPTKYTILTIPYCPILIFQFFLCVFGFSMGHN
mmetsp:Transcript_27272/g.55688  ORF Transcript_27272/g.55688 Transcript_27272/m.55688 type:complete len:103 (-) Transcript_27272:174-482(-)